MPSPEEVETPTAEQRAEGIHPVEAYQFIARDEPISGLAMPLGKLLRRIVAERPRALLGLVALAAAPYLLLLGPFWARLLPGVGSTSSGELIYGLTWLGTWGGLAFLGTLPRFVSYARPRTIPDSVAAGLLVALYFLNDYRGNLGPDGAFLGLMGLAAGALTAILVGGRLTHLEQELLEEAGVPRRPSQVLGFWGAALGILGAGAHWFLWRPVSGAEATYFEVWTGLDLPAGVVERFQMVAWVLWFAVVAAWFLQGRWAKDATRDVSSA